MKLQDMRGEKAAVDRAEKLFEKARKNGSYVLTVSMIVDGDVHHETVRLQSFPVGNLNASLNHIESAYYGMGMRRTDDEDRLCVPEGASEEGRVPMSAVRPLPSAD